MNQKKRQQQNPKLQKNQKSDNKIIGNKTSDVFERNKINSVSDLKNIITNNVIDEEKKPEDLKASATSLNSIDNDVGRRSINRENSKAIKES